jgi:hypothetical protein
MPLGLLPSIADRGVAAIGFSVENLPVCRAVDASRQSRESFLLKASAS